MAVKEGEENMMYKDEINIVYSTESEDDYTIFGREFVKINEKKIELRINGKKSKLVNKYKLKKGDNNIKIIIKDKLQDLQHMFHQCRNLTNIDELKYLNTEDCNNFSEMFRNCSSLSDIKSLANWNVSNGNNFSQMFIGCSSISDVQSLNGWNVSNATDFSGMFHSCSSIKDIKW